MEDDGNWMGNVDVSTVGMGAIGGGNGYKNGWCVGAVGYVFNEERWGLRMEGAMWLGAEDEEAGEVLGVDIGKGMKIKVWVEV